MDNLSRRLRKWLSANLQYSALMTNVRFTEPTAEIIEMTEAHLSEVNVIEWLQHPFPWPKQDIERSLRAPYRSHVFIQDASVKGYAIYQWIAGEVTVMNIAVDQNSVRQGIATKLLRHAIDQAQDEKDIDSFFLEVRESNKAAQKLYDSLGFGEIDKRKDYYPAADKKREDAIIMSLYVG